MCHAARPRSEVGRDGGGMCYVHASTHTLRACQQTQTVGQESARTPPPGPGWRPPAEHLKRVCVCTLVHACQRRTTWLAGRAIFGAILTRPVKQQTQLAVDSPAAFPAATPERSMSLGPLIGRSLQLHHMRGGRFGWHNGNFCLARILGHNPSAINKVGREVPTPTCEMSILALSMLLPDGFL